MRILFLDETAPKPYDLSSIHTTSQGGTEGTVIRIARGLAQRGHEANTCSSISDLGRYSQAPGTKFLCLRVPSLLRGVRSGGHRSEKLFLWAHDLFSADSSKETALALKDTGSKLICVSNFHAMQSGIEGARVLYNPVDPIVKSLRTTTYDPFQLIWFSSPHKGLDYALKLFEILHQQDSRYRFVVYNPGYIPTQATQQPGVVYKQGSYVDCLKDVAQSLCVFYPNLVFPETFGLVFAEANTLGVPVLTHDMGAAREILDHPSELVNCRDVGAVLSRVLEWNEGGRPLIKGKPQFELERVLNSLERILNESD